MPDRNDGNFRHCLASTSAMAYRDDREALEAQRIELRQALEEARRTESELGSAATRRTALERELSDVETRLKRATAALEKEKHLPGGRRRRWALLLALVPVVLGAGWLISKAASARDSAACQPLHKEGDAPPATPGGPILEYFSGGGIEGREDHLKVYADGRLAIDTFGRTDGEPVVRGLAALDRVVELARSRRGLSESTDYSPCVTDSTGSGFRFFGSGKDRLTESEHQELARLAERLFTVAMKLAPRSVDGYGGQTYTPQAAPAPPPDVLLRYTELSEPKPDYARLCMLLDVYKDGVLRCENTCTHVSSTIGVSGSKVYDRLKELADHTGTSGAHTRIENPLWPSSEVELFVYGHGTNPSRDTDWGALRELARNLAFACGAY